MDRELNLATESVLHNAHLLTNVEQVHRSDVVNFVLAQKRKLCLHYYCIVLLDVMIKSTNDLIT
jgi:hypothetical protein